MMVPIAQKQTGITIVFASSFDDPVYKCQAVLVVYNAVAFQPKMDISKSYCSFEQIHLRGLNKLCILVIAY